jgi:hypothetical protein
VQVVGNAIKEIVVSSQLDQSLFYEEGEFLPTNLLRNPPLGFIQTIKWFNNSCLDILHHHDNGSLFEIGPCRDMKTEL